MSSWFKKRNIFQRINKKPNHGCIWEEDILNSREGKKTYFNSLVSLKQNFIDNNDSSTGKFSENWSLRNSPPQFLGFLGNLCQGTGCLQTKEPGSKNTQTSFHSDFLVLEGKYGKLFCSLKMFSNFKIGKGVC